MQTDVLIAGVLLWSIYSYFFICKMKKCGPYREKEVTKDE
jgi:hypothetical protein